MTEPTTKTQADMDYEKDFNNRLAHRAEYLADIIWDYTVEFGCEYDLDIDKFINAETKEEDQMIAENPLYGVLRQYLWANSSMMDIKDKLHSRALSFHNHLPVEETIDKFLKEHTEVKPIEGNLIMCIGQTLDLVHNCANTAKSEISFYCPECNKIEKYALCDDCKTKWYEHQKSDLARQLSR